jgi:malonate decarboxylase delta subunit
METINLEFDALGKKAPQKNFVGVVASGDLEILLEPSTENKAQFVIKSSTEGKQPLWNSLIKRIVEIKALPSCKIFINDFGASPGVIQIRLEQILKDL